MLEVGTRLGRYTVRQHLGAGGMGDIYLALDPALERHVAVKVLPESLASDADRLARFVREAKAASALNHPGILTVFDFGQEGATHFLVTEFVDGQTLREWCEEARPPLADVLGVMAQAAAAIAAAHEAGIVHRDVKPENLMRRRDGLVKVLDFGIAKLVADAPVGADTDADTDPNRQTMPGTILGTTRYMSPEQALGAAVDARSDVWSLGVVLYELIAGKPPFDGPTPMGTLAMIIGREAEPLDVDAPDTPEAVSRIVARALRKRPGERFATAAEMAREMARAAAALRSGAQQGTDQDEARTIALEAAGATEPRAVAAPTNLLPSASGLIGRERELAEVTATLRAPGARLLTLTGPGGTGKTRLAVEAARVLLLEFADGAFVVDLSPLSDPSQIAAHVAEVFCLKESPERSLAEELERYLADKRLLLVLDNFEHLLEGAPVVSRLLEAAPRLTVLVTSRAPLHLSAEREYAVEPLEVPAFASLPPLDELGRAPAVALFVERAREAKASFALTAENARAVVEICRRLDGLPLALELAAARVKLLSPQAMLARLDHRLSLLTGGARDLPSRQQTMRGAVAWSYELLDERDKAVMRRLAAFAGGCSLEAAEAVCGRRETDVLDALGSLVDKSLLRQREHEDGGVRFTMLEVVREYALEQLEASGEADEVRLAHSHFFLELAKEAEPNLQGAESAPWLERVGREQENLRAALGLLLEQEPEAGARLAAALGQYWFSRSLYTEGRGWLARALATGAADPAVRARLLRVLSSMEALLGDSGPAAEHAREAVEAGRATGDRGLLAAALNSLGIALSYQGDMGRAREVWEEGLAIAREAGSGFVTAFLNNLGEAAREEGDYRAARAYYEQVLEVQGRHLRTIYNAVSLLNLGGVSLQEGDVAGARAFLREALAISSELGDAFYSAMAIDGLAAVALEAGERERAARLAGAVEAVFEAVGAKLQLLEQSLRDRYVAKLGEELEPDVLEREWARGRTMTLSEAVDAALGDDS
jgi:non-specific serine/threonine protein kinase